MKALNPKINSLGQYLDFLGAKLPDIEEGDVITDAVVLLVSHGEAGEDWHIECTQDMSALKVAGLLAAAYHYNTTPPPCLVTVEESA